MNKRDKENMFCAAEGANEIDPEVNIVQSYESLLLWKLPLNEDDNLPLWQLPERKTNLQSTVHVFVLQISRLSRREAVLLRLLWGDRRHGPVRPHHPLPALVQAEPWLVSLLPARCLLVFEWVSFRLVNQRERGSSKALLKHKNPRKDFFKRNSGSIRAFNSILIARIQTHDLWIQNQPSERPTLLTFEVNKRPWLRILLGVCQYCIHSFKFPVKLQHSQKTKEA